MRLHGFTGKDLTKELGGFVSDPPGLFFYREVGVAIFTWHELRAAVGFDFGAKPVTTHYATVEEFLHHEMPTFDMTEPSEEDYPDPKERAKVWKKKKKAAVRKFYADVQALTPMGLARRDESGDVHLGMGNRSALIEADRAQRKARRAARRGEVPATETVTPAPRKAAPKALAESTAPVVDVKHEVVQPANTPEPVHVPAKPAPKKELPTIQQSEREIQWAREAEKKRELERRKRAFADWCEWTGHPDELWEMRDTCDYQGYLNSLQPQLKSEPEVIGEGNKW